MRTITEHPCVAAHINELALAAAAWHQVATTSPTALVPAWTHLRWHQRTMLSLCIELGVNAEMRDITRVIADALGNGDDVRDAILGYIADVEVVSRPRPYDVEADCPADPERF